MRLEQFIKILVSILFHSIRKDCYSNKWLLCLCIVQSLLLFLFSLNPETLIRSGAWPPCGTRDTNLTFALARHKTNRSAVELTINTCMTPLIQIMMIKKYKPLFIWKMKEERDSINMEEWGGGVSNGHAK